MQRNLDEVVAAVCRLPIDYTLSRTSSAVDLLRSSGYLALRAAITTEDLARYLVKHDDCVTAWLQWSEDTRATPSWYITERAADETIVGYFDKTHTSKVLKFNDRIQAYATYVHRSLESIADVAPP